MCDDSQQSFTPRHLHKTLKISKSCFIVINPSIINWKRNLVFVWISQFLSTVGFSFAMPFIPFYIQDLGIECPQIRNMWIALFTAAGYLSFCLSAPLWGFVADIYGRRIMILRANFVSAICVVLMAFVPNVGCLVFMRFVMGAFAGTVTACQILISGTTPHANRGFAIGSLSSAVFGGSMAGTFFGGIVVDRFGYHNAFFICATILAIAGLVALFGAKENFHRTSTLKNKFKKLKLKLPAFGVVWMILLLIVLVGFTGRFDRPYLPVLVEKINGRDMAASWTGIINSLSAIGGMIAGPLLGWLVDKTSAPTVAFWSAIFAGLLAIPQGLATSLGFLMITRFGMIFCAGGLDPIFQIWLAKSTPDNKRGLFFGWASSAKSFGWFLSSIASGAVAISLGVRGVYLCAGILFLLLAPVIKLTVASIKRRSD